MSIGNIHKLAKNETYHLREHLLRLDKTGRRSRFGHSVSDTFIEKYADLPKTVKTVIYGYFEDGAARAMAELRPLGEDWGEVAEAAFSVEADFQDKGIATELMGRIIRSARNKGVQRLYVSCLAENKKMQRIAKKYEAELKFEHGEVVGEILPEHRSISSVIGEVIDDEIDYLMTVLHLDGSSREPNDRQTADSEQSAKKVA